HLGGHQPGLAPRSLARIEGHESASLRDADPSPGRHVLKRLLTTSGPSDCERGDRLVVAQAELETVAVLRGVARPRALVPHGPERAAPRRGCAANVDLGTDRVAIATGPDQLDTQPVPPLPHLVAVDNGGSARLAAVAGVGVEHDVEVSVVIEIAVRH